MIKQILNRLPRRNSFDGNDTGMRAPALSSNSSHDSSIASVGGTNSVDSNNSVGSNKSLSSREPLAASHKLNSRSLTDASLPNGTINKSVPPLAIVSFTSPSVPLPLFRDMPVLERPNLFFAKLKLCSCIYDFRDPTKNLKEKDIKKQTLLELVDFISAGNMEITEQVIEEVTKMVATNLFRSLPPSFHESGHLESFDFDEEEPTMEPAWPHLQVVYEFFLRFVTSADLDPQMAKAFINYPFVLKLIELFDSEDSRERDCLKTVLHRIYGKFMMYRTFIRKAINNVFYGFVFETERHNGIAELLEILGSIINGFACPLKEEHKVFLRRALIPLHKVKCVAMYHRQLCYCMVQFIDKDHRLAEPIIKGLLKYWPLTNSHKEVLFLGELEDILEVTQPEEFQRCLVPLFRQLARCFISPHFQVAERALFFWNNDHFITLVVPNREIILPLIFHALEKNTNGHWNQAIHGMTMNARKLFLETDQELFQECKSRFKEQEANAAVLQERQNLMWKQLEAMVV